MDVPLLYICDIINVIVHVLYTPVCCLKGVQRTPILGLVMVRSAEGGLWVGDTASPYHPHIEGQGLVFLGWTVHRLLESGPSRSQ